VLCRSEAKSEVVGRFAPAAEWGRYTVFRCIQCWRYLSLTVCDIIEGYGRPRLSQDAEDSPHGDIAAGVIRRPGVLARQVPLGTPASR
jgi:hypothetical protein